MIEGFSLSAQAVLALVLGAWIAVAAWAVVRGLRARAERYQLRRWGEGLAALLSTAPAAYAVIDGAGRVAGSGRLAALLGAEIDQGEPITGHFDPEDGARLAEDIVALKASGASFTRLARTARGNRMLAVHGVPVPRDLGAGVAVLWLVDATRDRGEVRALTQEAERRGRALTALSTLIEAAPFPMWLRGGDLGLALVNAAYAVAVEASDGDDAVARRIELMEGGHGPEGAARARAASEMLTRIEPVIIGGARRMLKIVDVPLGEAGVAGFAFDVEEVEDLRRELGRLERAQRATFDRLSAAIAMFGADRSLTFFNQPFLRLFGIDAEWLADEPEFERVLDRMRENSRVPESRDYSSWRAERRGWFNAAVDVVEESWSLPGGEHLRVLAQPHSEGGLLLIVEDRTEHMRLASARDTLLRVQAATLDNLFEAVAVFAANGRLTLWNSRFARLWQLDPIEMQSPPHVDELVTAAAAMMQSPQRAELLRDFVRSATSDRKQRSGRFALADGRHLEFAAVPLPDGNALFTILDVTDSRRIEAALRDRNEALEAADRMKSAFVANMSYELRTPLTSITGFAEMLRAGYAGELNPQQQGYVDPILEAAERLKGLIDNILDLAISEAGGVELDVAAFDVGALAREVVDEAREAAVARRLDLSVDIRADAGTIDGDRRRLKQALGHVVANALAFTPGGGKVMVVAEGDGQEARLIVSDSGIGIPPDEQARVFDTFHGAGNAKHGAVGLGLPLVRRFATLHGGRVELVSAVGQGTMLTIHLPRFRPA